MNCSSHSKRYAQYKARALQSEDTVHRSAVPAEVCVVRFEAIIAVAITAFCKVTLCTDGSEEVSTPITRI